MKQFNYQKIIPCVLNFLALGIFTAAHTTSLIAPFFLNGRSFEARSSTIQNIFYFIFSLGFSAAYFLLFRFLWTKPLFRQIIQRIENSPRLIRALFILLTLTGLLILAVQIKIITFPYPLELREGAIQLSTHALLNGINPYSLINNPVYINPYGILYNLLVLPFAALFGNSLQLHRLINGLLILGQLFLMVKNHAIA